LLTKTGKVKVAGENLYSLVQIEDSTILGPEIMSLALDFGISTTNANVTESDGGVGFGSPYWSLIFFTSLNL